MIIGKKNIRSFQEEEDEIRRIILRLLSSEGYHVDPEERVGGYPAVSKLRISTLVYEEMGKHSISVEAVLWKMNAAGEVTMWKAKDRPHVVLVALEETHRLL